MRVDFYSTNEGYGFLVGEKGRVYFRGEDFFRDNEKDPMPISGEEVEIKEGVIRRTKTPQPKIGVVESFDSQKGWGFIREYGKSEKVFLHRSEMIGTWVPIKGKRVKYYVGSKDSKPRACYIERSD